ncbi:hypothetical protein BDV98DRAFT_587559 [Pterulicium gracile]|uniref:Uncharacterized protein n=1 Tax=Pterulicium gracile TaxID=1884261 RepID=A0A5C3QYC6_9AGAR|nr:hypothetical protein BDV98DRAFT_587559 [Pterula gracilis]
MQFKLFTAVFVACMAFVVSAAPVDLNAARDVAVPAAPVIDVEVREPEPACRRFGCL